jgi:hypothetical protein
MVKLGKRRFLNLLTSAYLAYIRNSLQNPKRGRSVLAVFDVISMLNYSAFAYSLGFGFSGLSFAFDQKI